MRTRAKSIVAGLLLASLPALAQDNTVPVNRSVYRVEFNIRDGNPVASTGGRRYTMLIENEGRNSVRVGSKVPYVTGSTQTGAAPAVSTQYNYADIGVNIDCRLREMNGRVSIQAEMEISSVLSGGVPTPTVQSARVVVVTTLEPGKPALLTTIDDPIIQRKLNIEATATKVN